MTDQAQPAARSDLVRLYADRLKARERRRGDTLHYRPSAGGVQTFGRRPAIRQLTTSRRRRTMTALMATAVFAGSTPLVASASSDSHEIQPGETLSAIAHQYDVSAEQLARVNKIEDPDTIYAGDSLLVDGEIDVAVGDTVYRIKQGDTLHGVAEAHGVTMSDLLAMNEIENPDLIYPGDSVIIPTRSQYETEENATLGVSEEDGSQDQTSDQESSLQEASSDDTAQDDQDVDSEEPPPATDMEIASLHLVARGETLGSISQRYGVPVDLLMQANDIEDESLVNAGTLLNIPVVNPDAETGTSGEPAGESTGTILENVPAIQQSLSLSCESAALSIATGYWGNQISEWVFIENMPYDPNPHHGFRGDMTGQFGGTDDYGVYARPLASMLANYGFVGEEFYTNGDPTELRSRIDQGQPVLVWMTSGASQQERFYEEHNGERFTLVPQQHVVVAYGYDDDGVYVSDPGTGQHRTFGWDEFIQSWSKFDGMSLAVYPNS